MLSNDDLKKHVRYALNHLYHLEQLRKSPLIEWFGFSNRYDAPSVLQRLLTDAIQTLRPGQQEPMRSQPRKTYEILLLRYIQQFSQQEVAHHIGVSERQFRREQNLAISDLAEALWRKAAAEKLPAAGASRLPDPAAKPARQDAGEFDAEWGWLLTARSEHVTNTAQLVEEILRMIQPVASRHQVALNFAPGGRLPELAVHPVALRQILLNLLRSAIAHAGGGSIYLEASEQSPFLVLELSTSQPGKVHSQEPFDQEENLLAIALRLSELSGGHLNIREREEKRFAVALFLPLVEGISVLAVDDNQDMIDLLQRYTMGTRYHLRGVTDPDLVFQEIDNQGSKVVILDVMMPKTDGWELLGRLRRHPKTGHIPVIILSIIAQEELALSLGAAALLEKPITQEKLLEVLDRVRLAHN